MIAVAILAGMAAVIVGPSSHAHATDYEWTPTSAQISNAEARLVPVAIADDPTKTAATATSLAVHATQWPSTVTGIEVVGTDRPHALADMGTPGAVDNADTRDVLLVQLMGTFTPRGLPQPSGAPTEVYSHALFAIDVATGYVIDFEFTNQGLALSSAHIVQIAPGPAHSS